MNRLEIIAAYPLVEFMASRGIEVKRRGRNLMACCPFHEDRTPSMSIDTAKCTWYCFPCERGGSVIDLVMGMDGLTAGDAMTKLGGPKNEKMTQRSSPEKPAPKQNGAGKLVKTYDYTDEEGNLLYQVARYEPKTFRQRAPDGRGGWGYSLEGVRRVLYNLPKVMAADMVWICEGEKDADEIASFGYVATTNAMGAKKWCADYTAQLRGKDVIILPDGDKAGAEHCDLLITELGPAVKSIRVAPMPEGVKDVSDFIATFAKRNEGMLAIFEIVEKAEVLYRGVSVPVQTLGEIETAYREYAKNAVLHQLTLRDWLPSLRSIRPLVPGEVVAILGGTGTGKTAILQNIALHSKVFTLFIEAELPPELSFERFVAMSLDCSGGHVEESYRTDKPLAWRGTKRLDHIVCVHKPRVTPSMLAKIIESTELKTCHRPRVVLIDYIQLIGADAGSRYERASMVMEEMKIVARETNTVIVIASQVGRKDKKNDDPSIGLSDGKDSGSIENSSGLVLGAWRDADDSERMWIQVLKNTKGKSGLRIPCRIKESLRIYEEETPPE